MYIKRYVCKRKTSATSMSIKNTHGYPFEIPLDKFTNIPYIYFVVQTADAARARPCSARLRSRRCLLAHGCLAPTSLS